MITKNLVTSELREKIYKIHQLLDNVSDTINKFEKQNRDSKDVLDNLASINKEDYETKI